MVRLATAADAPAIGRLLHDFNREFDEPAPAPAVLEPRVRSFIVDGTKTYLLGGAGPDGVAQVTLIPTIWADRPIAHLDELYVRPERRGEGIGRALMEAVIELARQRDAAGLEVVTGEDDLAARALYESLGFANQIEGPDNARSLFYEREL